MKSAYDMTDEEIIEAEGLVFTGRHVVCLKCKGERFTSRLGAFTGDDLDEWYGGNLEERDEFMEQYTTRGGIYDERCSACKGNGVQTLEEVKEYLYFLEDEAERRAEDRYAGYGY